MRRKKYSAPDDGLNLLLFEPDTKWTIPSKLPSELLEEEEIGLDLETRDPLLRTHGPGTRRQDGYPVGISLANKHRGWYLPFEHQGGGNLDKHAVGRFVSKLLSDSNRTVIGAKILYDIDWLDFMGVKVNGKCIDIQHAECLIDEEADDYSLDRLAQKYLGVKKNEELLRSAAEAYGCDPKNDMWKLPSKYVGPYAEADALYAIQIYQHQKKLLSDEGLMKIFIDLETPIVPILLEMRKLGVRVDFETAKRMSSEWQSEIDSLQKELDDKYKMKINVNSGSSLAQICKIEGWEYPKTSLGNPSFDKAYFKYARSKTMKKVQRIRTLIKLKNDYVDKLILDFSHNGRIYASFNQMSRSDDGSKIGTRTGRFSCNRPNLQQVPSRDELAPVIRGFFIPENGQLWAKLDYSQQEPRILVHYASKMKYPGAEEARQAYIDNPDLDYYTFVAGKAGLERKPAKDLTLGIFYGEGIRKISLDLNMSVDQAKELRSSFEDRNPYVRDMYNSTMKVAGERGFIKSILGRHRHFIFWEPVDAWAMASDGKDVIPVRYEAAKKKWPGHKLRRAYTYKALNALIQGSAADMTKAAMLLVYREMGKVPHMQVHDELNYSVKNEAEALKIKYLMEHAIPEITVPMKADLDLGERWK